MNSKLVKASSALTLFVLMASVVAANAPAFALNGHGTTYGRGPQFGGGVGGASDGGAYLTYHDGLTINGSPFDISKFTSTIKTQKLYVNDQSDITVKIYNHQDIQMVQHVILFLDLHGSDPQSYQTNTYIDWDKKNGVTKADPNGLLKKVTTTVKYDGKTMYLTFHIVASKTMNTSHIIIRAWDSNLSQGQVVVLNAIKIVPFPHQFTSVGQ
ncbi:MAG TPA: hypothetical protein VFP45_01960 [Candidatus Nitrosotalea sp.]|nr:hypothetical protein [Candidatus Nitrosotalea sp.]